jgi:DNA-binding MarR family transcriptional regulator
VIFFFDALLNIQKQLMIKLSNQGSETFLSPREKSILVYIGNNPGCKSGDIAKKLGIPNPTVKRILPVLMNKSLIEKFGAGPGTNYALK